MNGTERWKQWRAYQSRRRLVFRRSEADPHMKNHLRHAKNAKRYARRHQQPPLEYSQRKDGKFRRIIQ